MKKIKNAVSVIILLVTFILVLCLMFTKISGQTPSLFGYQLLRISSPSMSPELEVGDIILSKNASNPSDIKVGNVVTYNGVSGEYAGISITHKVIVAPHKENSTYVLQTQGVANEIADPQISFDTVTGVMITRLTLFSRLYSIFLTPWGLIIILGLLAILFVNEIFTLRNLIKENDDNDKTKTE